MWNQSTVKPVRWLSIPFYANGYKQVYDTHSMSSEKKSPPSKDEIPVSPKTTTQTDISDALKENMIRVIDEAARIQPQISQSISSLQADSTAAEKKMIQNAFAAQKQIASSMNFWPVPTAMSELIAKQSTEMTDNFIKGAAMLNQLAINTFDAARENVKIYNKNIDTSVDFYTNLAKAWNPFWTWQPQQVFRA